MKTLNYRIVEEIKVGEKYYFGQLVDLEDKCLLESEAVAFYNEESETWMLIEFDIVELDEESLFDTVVVIRNISEM